MIHANPPKISTHDKTKQNKRTTKPDSEFMAYTVHASVFVHTSGIVHIYQNLTLLLQILPAQHDHMKTTPVINAPPMDYPLSILSFVSLQWHRGDTQMTSIYCPPDYLVSCGMFCQTFSTASNQTSWSILCVQLHDAVEFYFTSFEYM